MAKPLERSSLEAYGSALLAILAAGLPMTWWLKGLFWLVAAVLLTDISWRSPWTVGLGKHRWWISLLSVGLVAAVAVALVYRQYIEDGSGAVEGDLIACSCNCGKEGSLILEVGDTGAGFVFGGDMENPPSTDLSALEGPTSMLQAAYDSGIRLEHGKRGLEVTTTVKNRNGDVVVEVDRNHWKVTPLAYDKNYTSNTLEVKDSRKHVVLWLRVFADKVQIQGEWRDEFGNGLRLIRCQPPGQKEMGCFDKWNNVQQERRSENHLIEPMFEYPSKEHWGESRKIWPIHP